MLDGDRYADAVRADELQARRYGISGVPFFVIDEKYGVSGAHICGIVKGRFWKDDVSALRPEEGVPAAESVLDLRPG